jgi:hypothetical protein
MARPIDPNSPLRVGIHRIRDHAYATSQRAFIDPETQEKKWRHIHWGSVDDNLKFKPGSSFYLASPEERAALIFPPDWDISEALKFTGMRSAGRPICDYGCRNSLFGDIWLVEQVAERTGVRQDLERVFGGNRELVDDILTMAMYPYLTRWSYNRLEGWQDYTRTPSSRALTPSVITAITQSISERHRLDLLKLRGARVDKGELCAVDSTSRSAYGNSLADIRFGHDKEKRPLPQTTEVVVYTLSNHMPVYYRTFPGNIPDSRVLDTIFVDLDHAGFKNIILVTDRGFESIHNIENYMLRGQKMIMAVKTCNKDAAKAIKNINNFEKPDMEFNADNKIYYRQYDINYSVNNSKNKIKQSDNLKLNLYFNPTRRVEELLEINVSISCQKLSLDYMITSKDPMPDDKTIKNDYCYHDIVLDNNTRTLLSYTLNEKAVDQAYRYCGFFAIMSHAINYTAMEIYNCYKLRDEQEKYFEMMKTQNKCDIQRNWSEKGKIGRLFILFISLILGSYIRHIWKSTKLHDLFPSSIKMLDAMRSIRCIEHPHRARVITPFVGKQVDICEAFGFKIPDGCAPAYPTRQQPRRKRGRPPKRVSSQVSSI